MIMMSWHMRGASIMLLWAASCILAADGMRHLPKFKGGVHIRPAPGAKDDDGFALKSYQLASSSYPGYCEPATIIHPKRETSHSDIKKAIAYASMNQISISIRSGGHQYNGFSSTKGNNIQLDMADYNELHYDPSDQSLTIGVGCRIAQVNAKCRELKIFFPHGECASVGFGGHLHTGGYSVFTRQFGMFIDYVLWFEIITADGKLRRIHKPCPDKPNQDNDDLWFSCLGGSPGGFGVVVRMKVACVKDEEYPHSRGVSKLYPWTQESLRDALALMEKYTGDRGLSGDFSFSVIALSAGQNHALETDCQVRCNHPDVYGEKPYTRFVNACMPACVCVSAFWTGGSGENPAVAEKFWKDIEDTMSKHRPAGAANRFHFGLINGLEGISDPRKHTPLSVMMAKCCWPFARVFDLPFRTHICAATATNIKERGFAEWVSQKAWEIEKDKSNGLSLGIQFGPLGGEYSALANKKEENPTALAHRRSLAYLFSTNVFYQTKRSDGSEWPDPFKRCTRWIRSVSRAAIGPHGIASADDKRFLYAPRSGSDNPLSPDVSLDDDWHHYYDDRSVYERVLRTKLKFDPNHVFTTNSFCVGYKDKCSKLQNSSRAKMARGTNQILKKRAHGLGKTGDPAPWKPTPVETLAVGIASNKKGYSNETETDSASQLVCNVTLS